MLVFVVCLAGCGTNKNKEDKDLGDEIMTLLIGNYSFDVKLESNETVKKLLELLPLEIEMTELNGNEKYYYLDSTLPANAKSVGKINAGDVMLYGNDCLVIFYESFSSGYSYTKIGHIEDVSELKAALGKGSVSVIWKA